MRNLTVYGSLLEGMGNWYHILNNENAKKIDSHIIEGPYVMVSYGAFPGIVVHDAITSKIRVETFLVTDAVYQRVERLEGFMGQDNPNNFYNKRKIETPFGESEIYVLNHAGKVPDKVIVPPAEDGIVDWRVYVQNRNKSKDV